MFTTHLLGAGRGPSEPGPEKKLASKGVEMKTRKLTFSNDFHDTKVTVKARAVCPTDWDWAKIEKAAADHSFFFLSQYQLGKIHSTLCVVHGCQCSNKLATRGPQEFGRFEVSERVKGGIIIELYNLGSG